ncbi:hypothetical protein Fmac_011116 [Flemingia macrophylla]|uniref:Uncharacterized protein n=1 Tax=Flemingia macrophylla TaxID=520843 RepID=A0ABD1MLJ0_9FABA
MKGKRHSDAIVTPGAARTIDTRLRGWSSCPKSVWAGPNSKKSPIHRLSITLKLRD